MTERDFAILGEAIKTINNPHLRSYVADLINDACVRSSWRFEPARFYKTCGINKSFYKKHNITR